MITLKKNLFVSLLTMLILLTLPLVCFAGGYGKAGFPVTSSSDEAVQLFEQGRDAYEMGRMGDALLLLDKALQKDAHFASAWLYKAYAAEAEAEWKSYLDQALRYSSYASAGEKILIDIALTYSDNDVAERFRLAKRLTKLHPKSARALLVLAGEYQMKGEFLKFRDLANEAISLEPESPLGYRALAASFMFNEPTDFSLAEKYIRKFVDLRPNEASAWVSLGDVLRASLDLEPARNAYSNALKIDQSSVIALSKRAYVETYLGMFDDARSDFKKARILASESREKPNRQLVSYLFPGNGKIMGSEIDLASSAHAPSKHRMPLAGDSDNCYFCCTFISMVNGLYIVPDKSLTACRCLQREFNMESHAPESKVVEANFAFVDGIRAVQLKDLDKARKKALEYAEISNPGIPPVKNEAYNFMMGMIHYAEGSYNKSVNCFNRSDVSNICVKYNLGLAYDKLGQFEEAEKMFADVTCGDFGALKKPQMVNIAGNWLKSLTEAKMAER
jgi:tetratricopeptide (TPR) repeat protein